MEKRRWAEAASEGRCGEIEQVEGVRETVKEQWRGQLRKVGKDAEWTVCAARTRQMVEADARALSNGGFTQVTMVDLAAWQASKDAITGQELDHSCRHLLTYPFVLWQIFLGRSSTSIQIHLQLSPCGRVFCYTHVSTCVLTFCLTVKQPNDFRLLCKTVASNVVLG